MILIQIKYLRQFMVYEGKKSEKYVFWWKWTQGPRNEFQIMGATFHIFMSGSNLYNRK